MKTCCGLFSLQTGTKIIAIISIILGFWSLVNPMRYFFVRFVIEDHPLTFSVRNLEFGVELVVNLIDLIISFVLLYGAFTRKITPVRVWLWFNFVFLILYCFIFLGEILSDEFTFQYIIFEFLHVIPILPFLYFVNEFRKELLLDEENPTDASQPFQQL